MNAARTASPPVGGGLRLLILDRYTMREFSGPFLGAVAGFTIILISGLLFELTDLILVKNIEWHVVGRMLVYKLPSLVVVSLPIGVLFAVLLALGRLVKDSEMTVIRCSGMSFTRLIVPLLFLALGVSLLTLLTNERIVPWGNHNFENIVRDMVFKDPVPSVEAQVFFRDAQGTVFYVREVDHARGTLEDVMIYEVGERETKFPRIITAQRGRFEEKVWHLEHVVTRALDTDGFVENEVMAPELVYPLTERMETFFGTQKTTDEMNRAELGEHIRLFQRSGISVRPFLVDYHLKLALPFASLVFALLGAPLSLRSARTGRFFGASVALGVAFLYFAGTSVSRSLGANGVLPPLAAAWLPTALFALLGLYMIYRADRS